MRGLIDILHAHARHRPIVKREHLDIVEITPTLVQLSVGKTELVIADFFSGFVGRMNFAADEEKRFSRKPRPEAALTVDEEFCEGPLTARDFGERHFPEAFF